MEMQDLQTRLAALDVIIRQVMPAPCHAHSPPHQRRQGHAICSRQLQICHPAQPEAFSSPLQPPTITGRYSGATFSFFMQPAQGEFRAVMAVLKAMTRTAGLALRGSGCGQYRQLQADISALEESRCTLFLPLSEPHLSSLGVSDGLAHMALAVTKGLRRSDDRQVSPRTARSHSCTCEHDKAIMSTFKSMPCTSGSNAGGQQLWLVPAPLWSHCCFGKEQV